MPYKTCVLYVWTSQSTVTSKKGLAIKHTPVDTVALLHILSVVTM